MENESGMQVAQNGQFPSLRDHLMLYHCVFIKKKLSFLYLNGMKIMIAMCKGKDGKDACGSCRLKQALGESVRYKISIRETN